MNSNGYYDLEDRLVDFAVSTISLIENLQDSKTGKHVANQLLRSGTSPAPNYGESQAAESLKDFIHKMKVCLKELRESLVWLKIILKANLYQSDKELVAIMNENNELISIFVKSIKTAKSKLQKEQE